MNDSSPAKNLYQAVELVQRAIEQVNPMLEIQALEQSIYRSDWLQFTLHLFAFHALGLAIQVTQLYGMPLRCGNCLLYMGDAPDSKKLMETYQAIDRVIETELNLAEKYSGNAEPLRVLSRFQFASVMDANLRLHRGIARRLAEEKSASAEQMETEMAKNLAKGLLVFADVMDKRFKETSKLLKKGRSAEADAVPFEFRENSWLRHGIRLASADYLPKHENTPTPETPTASGKPNTGSARSAAAAAKSSEGSAKSSKATNNSKEDSADTEKTLSDWKSKLQMILDAVVQDPSVPKQTKINLIIHSASLICAIVACQPLPFADIFVLTPIQLLMVTALNKVIGNPFEKSSLKELVSSLLVVVGWGTLAQHVILGLYKSVLPFLGGVTTVPLVYGATFALGSCAKILMEAKQNDREISKGQLKKIFEQQKKEAQSAQQKLTPAQALKQVQDLLKNSGEYNKYKTSMLELQRQIGICFAEDTALEQDVSRVIEQKKLVIQNRVAANYPNLELSDFVASLLAVMNGQAFLETAEPVLAQLSFHSGNGPRNEGEILDFKTPIGVFLAERNEKLLLLSLDLKEQYKEGSVLKYMTLGQSGSLLQDEDISQAFHTMISQAKRYLYIVSPWVGRRPYQAVCELMRENIAQNPDLTIKMLYGYEKGDEKLENSRRWVGRYKEKLGRNLSTKETFTHAKLVLCDDETYLLGSMNVLSFGGDYSEGDVRNELALLSEDKVTLQKLKKYYFNW